jgi:mannose-6-phosphate isomerase-like protein (cupin superfamily)
MALGEVMLPPHTPGPHLHVHSREDEMFFVLEGVLTVQIGEELHDIAAGGLAWGARGTPHAFANCTVGPAIPVPGL